MLIVKGKPVPIAPAGPGDLVVFPCPYAGGWLAGIIDSFPDEDCVAIVYDTPYRFPRMSAIMCTVKQMLPSAGGVVGRVFATPDDAFDWLLPHAKPEYRP